MESNPLAPPVDQRVLDLFLRHFQLRRDATSDPRQLLSEVARAFSRLPYENLSKIVRQAESDGGLVLRGPADVMTDHVALGTGGTCFSLTATLLHLLRALGWQAEPILADRRYGVNTHCALLVWIDDQPHLLDPGYLIVDPIPLRDLTGSTPTNEQRLTTSFNQLVLRPQQQGEKIELLTQDQNGLTSRLTFKTTPVDAGEFLHVWQDSFDWDMMHYPVLSSVVNGTQRYLQGQRLQLRRHDGVTRCEIANDELVAKINAEFGIDHSIAMKALEILRREKT